MGSLFLSGKLLATVVDANGVEAGVLVVETMESFRFESDGISKVRSVGKWVDLSLSVAGLSSSETET